MTTERGGEKLIADSTQSVVGEGKVQEDPLSDLFSSAVSVDGSSSRLSQYKCRLRDETNQEIRRRLLLQQQKDKRNATFNERRCVGAEKNNEGSGDHWFDNEIFTVDEDVDDNMEWSSIKKVAWHKRGKIFKDVLMYSEWFLDIPTDVSDKWIMVPCPVGKRTLIVSKQRGTRSFSKKGITVCNFKSLLPSKTILDCIWSFETKSFYVIDVIQWNGMSFKDCQSEFRFYWLDSKFQENDYSLKSDCNDYPMIKLSRCICNLNQMVELIHNYHQHPLNFPKLDGLLFYHCDTHYTSGYTPLVGWLKPFMLTDALGVPLNSDYGYAKPDGYINYKQFITEKDEKRKAYWDNKKLSRKNKMDWDEGSADNELMNHCCDSDILDDENCSVDIDT